MTDHPAADRVMDPRDYDIAENGAILPAADRVEEALSDVRNRLLIRDKDQPRGIIRDLTDDEWATLDAVRSTAPATGPGLEAERLAEAIWDTSDAADERPFIDTTADQRAMTVDWAREIVTTYAALRAATEARSTGGIREAHVMDRVTAVPFDLHGDDLAAVLSAVDHLLGDHDCDRLGYEEVMGARDRLREARSTGGVDEVGEPVWAILYEDPDHLTETFFGAGAEDAARHRFAQARQTWNCTLFRQYAPMGWDSPDAHTAATQPERRDAGEETT